jgi:hypothetical protein
MQYIKSKEGAMTMTQVKSKAKEMGIQVGKAKKDDLIRTIQTTEGNIPCYKTGITSCDQTECAWWSDCMPKN